MRYPLHSGYSGIDFLNVVLMKSLWLLPSLWVACVQAEPLQKSFNDWQITCNNEAFVWRAIFRATKG